MEFEGTIVNRNNRAKEQVLYKVIAEKELLISVLREELKDRSDTIEARNATIDDLTAQLRTLKSKEYRRTVRRKKAKVEVATV